MDIKIGQLWQRQHNPLSKCKIIAILHLEGAVIIVGKAIDDELYYSSRDRGWTENWEMIPEKWEPKNPPPTERPCEVYFTDRTKANFGRCKNTAIAKYTVDGAGMKMNLCQSCAVNIYGYKAKIIGEPH